MAKEYLDKDGLLYFWQKIKNIFATKTDLNTTNTNVTNLSNNKADKTEAVKNITRSGNTFTATKADNTTFTFTQTDTNNAVTQTATTTNADYEVLFSATNDNTTRTEGARKNTNLKFNPSTGNLQATQLNGVTIGSSPKFTDTNTTYGVVSKTANGLAPQLPNETTTTKYLRQDGTWVVPPNTTYGVVSKTANGLTPQLPNETTTTKYLRQDGTWQVPPNTGDTHYTTHIYAGDGTASNKATTNGNTKLTAYDNSTARESITIKGTGATTVVSDANGVITINSTDNNTTYGLVGANGTQGLVKNGSTVTSASGYTASPIIGGVPYYKDTNTTYSTLTQALVDTGTETTGKLVTAKILRDSIDKAVSSGGGVFIAEWAKTDFDDVFQAYIDDKNVICTYVFSSEHEYYQLTSITATYAVFTRATSNAIYYFDLDFENGWGLRQRHDLISSSTASSSANGLMSSTDKSKLDSIKVTNGVLDSSMLPSYVDDVIEAYARSGQTALSSGWLSTTSGGSALTPETGKIYVLMADSGDYSANSQFRWSGSAYVKLADGGVSAVTNAEIDTIVAS